MMGSIKELEEGYRPSGGYKNTARELRVKDMQTEAAESQGSRLGML